MKPKHVPIRTCVSCRQSDEKRDLMRVVRMPDGLVVYDPKGKISGRGAYVCASEPCISLARKHKKLERSLNVPKLPETLFADLVSAAGGVGDNAEPIGPQSNGEVNGAYIVIERVSGDGSQ